ncbi:uncharacterized protein CLUP02_03147 [Colletotrichum lupini]|uniref:Uncharacterized protein n=1 Tax=Colletotrichum lupini TaxID=145971 RepID=A0A9Q8WC24_9PEZI|nr:uncharacterized protein CLUP02_03147 [Colletotrichum lupini]KAK1721993.1 hypothetical protein BDP67DRAFT_13165 [Colletotrichum lupini]UQC77676.1 hypothetical protein CLUP02_03147 [Colletotrichum lupini]
MYCHPSSRAGLAGWQGLVLDTRARQVAPARPSLVCVHLQRANSHAALHCTWSASPLKMYVDDSARLRAESHGLGCGLALVVRIRRVLYGAAPLHPVSWPPTARPFLPKVNIEQGAFWLAERYSATSHGCNAGTQNVHCCVIPLRLCEQSMQNCYVYGVKWSTPFCSSRRGFMKLQRDWDFLPLPEEIPQKTARSLSVSTPDWSWSTLAGLSLFQCFNSTNLKGPVTTAFHSRRPGPSTFLLDRPG